METTFNDNGRLTVVDTQAIERESANPHVSVIIGFKDRGLGRLEMCIRSIHDSLSEVSHEVIVADYGSSDTESISNLLISVNAKHELIATDGEWSAARARNAGVRAATGRILLAVDADMLFTPKSLARVVEQIERHPQELVILQCRDLPPGYTEDTVRERGLDWDELAKVGHLRPRWGVGGLVGLQRAVWERLRGWDERMHTYGGEDTDFAKRARRIGARVDWLDEPGVAMYHMWHPSAAHASARDAEIKAAVELNRKMHTHDLTFARNRVSYRYLPKSLPPLVTILLRSNGAPRTSVRETLGTILSQTVSDIEVLVDNDTASDVDDDRITVVDQGTIAWAPRGTYLMEALAGELWAESRLQELLAAWRPGMGLVSDRPSVQIVDEAGTVLREAHVPADPRITLQSTMILSSLASHKESEIRSANWRDVVSSVMASGAEWEILPKSLHVVSILASSEEQYSRRWQADILAISNTLSRCGLPWPHAEGQVIEPTPPASALATKEMRLRVASNNFSNPGLLDWLSSNENVSEWKWVKLSAPGGSTLWQEATLATDDLLRIASCKRRLFVSGFEPEISRIGSTHADISKLQIVEHLEEVYGDGRRSSFWLVAQPEESEAEEVEHALRSRAGINVVLRRTVATQSGTSNFVLARLRATSRDAALSVASATPVTGALEVIELAQSTDTTKAYA